MEDREGSQGPEINIEVTQSEPWRQEKGTECQYREVQRDRHPKKQEEISAREGGRRPRWQTQMDRVAPRDTESKDRCKGGNGAGESGGEDRGGQTGISEGRSPAQTPSRCFTDTTFPLNRWSPHFQTFSPMIWRPLLFGPSTSKSLTDNWETPGNLRPCILPHALHPRPSVSLPLIP